MPAFRASEGTAGSLPAKKPVGGTPHRYLNLQLGWAAPPSTCAVEAHPFPAVSREQAPVRSSSHILLQRASDLRILKPHSVRLLGDRVLNLQSSLTQSKTGTVAGQSRTAWALAP